MLLTRDTILQANDLPRELVSVPEWGGEVYVRTLTGTERDSYEAQSVEKRGKSYEANLRNLRAKLCALAMCDEQGKRLFGEGDVEALGAKSSAALDRVFSVARRLSGLGAEDFEELAKNSESAREGASSSALPAPSAGASANCCSQLTPAN
jgi:hypothetical protein